MASPLVLKALVVTAILLSHHMVNMESSGDDCLSSDDIIVCSSSFIQSNPPATISDVMMSLFDTESSMESIVGPSTILIVETTVPVVVESSMVEQSTTPIFEPSTVPIIESSTVPIIESSTVPVVIATTIPLIESSTVPIVELSTVLVTESSAVPVEELSTVVSPFTSTTTSTLLSTLQSTTLSTVQPTVQSTVQPTVQSTVLSTTLSTVQPTVQSTVPSTIPVQSTTVLTESSMISTTLPYITSSLTPSATLSTLNPFDQFFSNQANLIAVAAGGSIILLLLCLICLFWCCCCCYCYRRRRKKYIIENERRRYSNGGTRYRPSISSPHQLSYQNELRQVKEEREKLEMFAETDLHDINDTLHYQGHSQVQHDVEVIANSSRGLTRVTPLTHSQLMSQGSVVGGGGGGGISVDDDVDDEGAQIPEREETTARGGGDSPFMHLSDNLPPSRSSRSQNSQNKTPETHQLETLPVVDGGTASQYSYLGLGIHHGSDLVYTNTNSIMEDTENRSDVGMVGIDREVLRSRESDIHSFGLTRPLLNSSNDESLDDTPTKESSSRRISRTQPIPPSGERDLALLTSLESSNPAQSSNVGSLDRGNVRKKKSLSVMTSIPNPLTSSTTEHSDLQETPERHRNHTLTTPNESFKRATPNKTANSKLGRLTSLEYLRASLRMKLKKMTNKDGAEESIPEKPRQLKSALRHTSSISSYDSVSSTYTNSYAHDSPSHKITSPGVYPPYDYMGGGGGYPPHPSHHEYMSYMPGGPPLLDPYGVPVSPHVAPPGPVYTDQLSPILSVSQFDYHPPHHQDIGILPQYGGHPMPPMGYGRHGDVYYPSQPPHYDDYDDDDMYPAHNTMMNVSASQRVRWNDEHEIIPAASTNEQLELTPSDTDEDR